VGGAWVATPKTGSVRVGGAWVPYGPTSSGEAQSLFTPGVDDVVGGAPVPSFDEGGGLTVATGLIFRRPGVVTHGRFRFPAAPSGRYDWVLYRSTLNNAGGIQVARTTFEAGQMVAGGWGTVPIPGGVAVSAGGVGGVGYYAAVFSEVGRYTARSGFFADAGRDVGDLYAWRNAEDVLGDTARPNGAFTGSDTYPLDSFGAACYFVDLLFVAS
jgi:hypothetical protein